MATIDAKALSVLFTTTEDQQQAITRLLGQLATEIANLRVASAAATKASATSSQAAAAIEKAVGQVEQSVVEGIDAAVPPVMTQAFDGLSKNVQVSIAAAIDTTTRQMRKATEAFEYEVGKSRSSFKESTSWFATIGTRGIVVTTLVAWSLGCGGVLYEGSRITDMSDQMGQMSLEIKALREENASAAQAVKDLIAKVPAASRARP